MFLLLVLLAVRNLLKKKLQMCIKITKQEGSTRVFQSKKIQTTQNVNYKRFDNYDIPNRRLLYNGAQSCSVVFNSL